MFLNCAIPCILEWQTKNKEGREEEGGKEEEGGEEEEEERRRREGREKEEGRRRRRRVGRRRRRRRRRRGFTAYTYIQDLIVCILASFYLKISSGFLILSNSLLRKGTCSLPLLHGDTETNNNV